VTRICMASFTLRTHRTCPRLSLLARAETLLGRGPAATHRAADGETYPGLLAMKTTKSSSAVGAASEYPARSSMLAKPARSSISMISFVK
jgi:hypothetical protein